MKQRDYERVCKTIAKLCTNLYLNLYENKYKNKSKFLRYATIFENFSKIKLKSEDKYTKKYSKQDSIQDKGCGNIIGKTKEGFRKFCGVHGLCPKCEYKKYLRGLSLKEFNKEMLKMDSLPLEKLKILKEESLKRISPKCEDKQ